MQILCKTKALLFFTGYFFIISLYRFSRAPYHRSYYGKFLENFLISSKRVFDLRGTVEDEWITQNFISLRGSNYAPFILVCWISHLCLGY